MSPQGVRDNSRYGQQLSVDTYIAYAKSIALEIERRVIDNPPSRPAAFWRICADEIDVARWRMRNVSGQIRKIASAKTDV